MIINQILNLNNYAFHINVAPHIFTVCVIFFMMIKIMINQRFSSAGLTFSFLALAINTWILGVIAMLSLVNESPAQWWTNTLAAGVICLTKTECFIRSVKGDKDIPEVKTSIPIVIENEGLLIKIFVEMIDRYNFETQLKEYKTYLEKLVQERTLELENANTQLFKEIHQRKQSDEALRHHIDDLKKFKKITTDRENKLYELKKEANNLTLKLGRPDVFPL